MISEQCTYIYANKNSMETQKLQIKKSKYI